MNRRLYILPTLAIAAVTSACGTGSDTDDDSISRPRQCTSAEYVAFDTANHLEQDLRLGAYVEMLDRMAAAEEDPSTAAAVFTDLQANVYTRASLRDKVLEREDEHFDPPMPVGMALDDRIMAGFEAGKTATTAVDIAIARQAVDKTLIHFFYLSVFHEMVEGTRATWDEAYGYFGAPSDNAEGGRKGLASVATKRDGTNNTNLATAVFNGIVDGSCALTEALNAANSDELDIDNTPTVKAIVTSVDEDLQKVLAYSVGHEAFEMIEIQTNAGGNFTPEQVDEMRIKLAELDPYFAPLEGLMNQAGGDSMMRAARIRAALDAALGDATNAWVATFDAQAIIDDIEAAYGIDVRG